jgi:putative transposase
MPFSLESILWHSIIDYVVGDYSQMRPHSHNNGLSPNEAERQIAINHKPVAKNT